MLIYLLEPKKNVTWCLPYSVMRETIIQNLFFTGTIAFILEKFGYVDLFGPQETILYIAQNLPNYFLYPYNVFPDVCKNRQYEKNWSKNFFHPKNVLSFNQNFVVPTTTQVMQKWSLNFHRVCQNTFWTLLNRSLKFVTLDSEREIRPKLFVTGRIDYFQMFLSIDLLGPIEKYITCTIFVRCLVSPHKMFSELCDTWWHEKLSAFFFSLNG